MKRPFGYWIKHIDGRIEESFATLLAAEDLTRRGWQVLNTISDAGSITVAEVDSAMGPFLSPAEPTMRPYADEFVKRGWAALAGSDVITMTEDGRLAHRRVSSQVAGLRDRMSECLSPEEYELLMNLLQRVAAHLDA